MGRILYLIKRGDIMGWGKVLEITEKKDRFGLGYKPANEVVQ